jgi:tetratricopeptide (TPR) repeat protein
MVLLRGDWAATRRYLERSAEVRAQLGSDWNNPFHTTLLLRIEGGLHLAQGDVEAAVQCANAAAPLTKKAGTLAWRWSAIRLLAELDLHQGNPAASLDRLRSVDRADLIVVDLNELDVLMIWSHLALGSVEAAEELVLSALTRLREQHDHLNLVDAVRAEAAVHTRQRRWHAAETAVEESLALARQMGYPYAEAKALSGAGDLWKVRGQSELARDQYEAALAILYRLGERAYAEKIEQELAQLSVATIITDREKTS